MADYIPTAEQQAAIEHEGNMVITACPGSGKTTVVVEKIRRKLPELRPYHGVIGITFTVKASEELKFRCKKDAFDAKQSFFGTIDSFCLKEIILPFVSRLWGQADLVLNPVFFKDLAPPEKEALADFGKKGVETSRYDEVEPMLIRLYESGRILTSSTSLIACHIIENSLACRRYLTAKYDTIFIDEYQDSSEPQHQLFKKLVSIGMTGVAVGDEDQSIYGFRGGSKDFIEELQANGEFRSFQILTNHRCHPSISNYARRLYNPTCELQPAEDSRIFRGTYSGNQVDLARKISEWMPRVRERFSVSYNSDVAVLVRGNASLDWVSQGLSVPHRVVKDSPLTDIGGQHARLCIDLLKFRFDGCITVESILTGNLRLKMPRRETSSLRHAIRRVKTCLPELLIDALAEACDAILSEQIPVTIIQALTQIEGSNDQLELFKPVNTNEIQVMTLHKSKGLEFDVVFHLDLYEWTFPFRLFQSDYNALPVYPTWDQELNLHYVGITRAKKACFLLTSGSRLNSDGQVKNGEPSKFLGLSALSGLYSNLNTGS
ncbi:MAG: UvrD-helicase domain-containing protein [Endozoicomonas sp.]|uniref:UvrD-helicase domain-containing protein n=1 Tax=Endozoicomonas sp. TaxID=1892382 RepID=UPI003D9BA4B6